MVEPFRLKTYRFFEMGVDHHYYDEFQNRRLMQRIAEKSYLPANAMMLKLIKKHGKDFNIAFLASVNSIVSSVRLAAGSSLCCSRDASGWRDTSLSRILGWLDA